MFFGSTKKAKESQTTWFDDFVDGIYVKHHDTNHKWVKMKDLDFKDVQRVSSCHVGFEEGQVAFSIYGDLRSCSDFLKGFFYYTKNVLSSNHKRIDNIDAAGIIKAFFEVFDYDAPDSPHAEPTPQMISRSYYSKSYNKEMAYNDIMEREFREATGLDIPPSALTGDYVHEIDKRFYISSDGYIFKKENKDA